MVTATPSPVAAAGVWTGNSHQHQHESSNKGAGASSTAVASAATTTMTGITSAPYVPAPMVVASNANVHHCNGSGHRSNAGVPVAAEGDGFGVQTRIMSLKVHYTFDKEAKIQCLARCPQMLQIQTAAINDELTIGLVDLRTCIHVITEASPEITHQDCDYTIYAVDHSEPDLPLVGYGLLSWTIDSLLRGNPMGQFPKMVTGRVARNVLGVFGNGAQETLEIRLKLSEMARPRRPLERAVAEQTPLRSVPASAPLETTATPTSQSEWSSLLQSNPQIGQSVAPIIHSTAREPSSRQASPAVSQGPPPGLSFGPLTGPPPLIEQPELATSPIELREPPSEPPRIAPIPVDAGSLPPIPLTSSRPSSRTSNRPSRRKPPTGRPRGRPRKKATEDNTSGYEDGTEGEEPREEPREEGPAKKRVRTTMVGKAEPGPFSATHESLRVAASNSSSLRNFRPLATNPELNTAIQSQELPRAPTPVPQGRFRGAPNQGGNPSRARPESRLSQPPSLPQSTYCGEPRPPMSPSLDGRSPESLAPTPNYSEGSPLEIGSSPPVPRIMPFLRSSPPLSSPVLPPMPVARLPRESDFTNYRLNDATDGEQNQPQIEDEALPPPRASRNNGVGKMKGVSLQLSQTQAGSSGESLVHVRSYTTPRPSSSALAPPEQYAQPSGIPHAAPPLPSASPSKMKNRQSRSPTHQPATPPGTDAADLTATPGAGAQPPDALLVAEASARVGPEKELATTSQPRLHTHARLGLDDPSQTQDSARAENETGQPTLKTAWATSAPIDLSQDPVLQLALSFGMREVIPPKPLPPQRSPPPHQTPLPNTRRLDVPRESELPSVPPPPPMLGKGPRDTRPKHGRQAHRSQSAGPLALPVPAAPASEPSPLSRPSVAASEAPRPTAVPSALRRAASIGPLVLPEAENASAEVALPPPISTRREPCSPGEGLVPPSSPQAPRSNKNIVKKHAIKQRLEQAIIKGEMPPFCTNCGAIETPTWRKIWVQEKQGEPEDFELSEKPGRVTAVEIMQRDSDDRPVLHRIIKKSLAPLDDRKVWQEMLLCNPCGIWLSKSKSHRPPDRWEKDLSRLGQERRRRGTGRTQPRPKKPRFKDGVTRAHAVSEGYIPTDGVEPAEPSSPVKLPNTSSVYIDLSVTAAVNGPQNLDGAGPSNSTAIDDDEAVDVTDPRLPLGSAAGQKPADMELDGALGNTKRLLFPTPRKDGLPKALADVDINTVQLGEHQHLRGTGKEKQSQSGSDPERAVGHGDDLDDLFGSPDQSRPCTPPGNPESAPVPPCKTPTRRSPSHRPVTRSVSRSLRSSRSKKSSAHPSSHQTPSKTSGATLVVPGSNSAARRRSPRLNQSGFEDAIFNTPISRRIAQMLTDQTNFSIGGQEVDFDSLPALESQDGESMDFANLLSAEAALSSPAKQAAIGFDYEGAVNFWPNWNLESTLGSKD